MDTPDTGSVHNPSQMKGEGIRLSRANSPLHTTASLRMGLFQNFPWVTQAMESETVHEGRLKDS